jgi:polyhydroxybutyrate depolymerase
VFRPELLFVLSILPLAATARGDQPTAALPSPLEPGRFAITIASGGLDRVAHVQIPEGYKADSTFPLVLLLHGAGGNGSGILDKDGWAAKADKEGFVAVAPDGIPIVTRAAANFRTNPPLWNYGQLKTRTPRAAIDDVAFIRQLLDELKTKVPYNERRVFCAGHSNGGGMALRLAADIPERLVAAASVAGVLTVEVPKPKQPLPTLCILGTSDPLMPLAGGEIKMSWGTRQLPPVADSLALWAKTLGCKTEPTTLSDADGLKKVEYSSKSKGPTLSVIYIEGHGHHWPGGQRTLPESMVGPITKTLDATDTIWDFFAAHDPAAATK